MQHSYLNPSFPVNPSSINATPVTTTTASPILTLQRHDSLISANTTLLPAPGQRLPDLIVNPDPIQESLHQVLLRQPVTYLKDSLTDSSDRLYQYIQSYVLEPQQWLPSVGFLSVAFDVPEELWKNRSEIIEEQKGPFEVPKRTMSTDSLLFNLRCAKLDGQVDLTDIDSVWAALPTYWPQHFFISINGQHLDVRRKRHNTRDLPIDVTSCLQAGLNELTISIHADAHERDISHGVAIEVIHFCDHRKALTLPTRNSAELSLKSITTVMAPRPNPDDDDLILVDDEMTISITDPFSSKAFTTPVRGKTCKHRECFDLETFLDSRQSDCKDALTSVYGWQCPICKADVRPHKLVLDGFFQEVREKIVEQGLEDDARAIIVSVDGTWEVKQDNDTDQSTTKGQTRIRSQNPSPAPATKRMRPSGDEATNDLNSRRMSMNMSTSAPGIDSTLPPQNPRIIEIIELD